MTRIVRIDTDGSISRLDGKDLLAIASETFEAVDVVTCRSPVAVAHSEYLVGAIDDWGRTKGLPVNKKAWALYGRSPICGPMLLALDSNEDGTRFHIPDDMLIMLERPLEEWLAIGTLEEMTRILREEGIEA